MSAESTLWRPSGESSLADRNDTNEGTKADGNDSGRKPHKVNAGAIAGGVVSVYGLTA